MARDRSGGNRLAQDSLAQMWNALHCHFSEPEIVELSVVIALFSGGHRWIRTLAIGQIPATQAYPRG